MISDYGVRGNGCDVTSNDCGVTSNDYSVTSNGCGVTGVIGGEVGGRLVVVGREEVDCIWH
jgi:hypothetical protein